MSNYTLVAASDLEVGDTILCDPWSDKEGRPYVVVKKKITGRFITFVIGNWKDNRLIVNGLMTFVDDEEMKLVTNNNTSMYVINHDSVQYTLVAGSDIEVGDTILYRKCRKWPDKSDDEEKMYVICSKINSKKHPDELFYFTIREKFDLVNIEEIPPRSGTLVYGYDSYDFSGYAICFYRFQSVKLVTKN